MDTLENIGNGLMWVIFGSAAIVMMIDLLFNHPGIFLLVIIAIATFVVIARSNQRLWDWLFHYDPYDQPSFSFFNSIFIKKVNLKKPSRKNLEGK